MRNNLKNDVKTPGSAVNREEKNINKNKILKKVKKI